MTLLPEEIEEIRQLMEDIDMIFSGDRNYILSRSHYDEVFRLIVEIKERYNIINNPTAFMKIVQFARERMSEG